MRSTAFSTAFVAVCASYYARGAIVYRELPIVNANLAPDGFNRSTVVAGGTFPGPTISGNKGDNFQINVIDQLTDPTMRRATSVHWHGIFQKHTNEMDGPSFVNQCPIVPKHSFLYNFKVPDQAGTFWYHSHYSTQYCDGLRGPLVVYDPNDPQKYLYDIDNNSTVITLADWYHSVAPVLFPGPGGLNPTPPPDSTLINGKGRYPNGTATPLAIVNVQHGKRYRFRIINTSCSPSYNFTIDGHNLTIIETDGQATVPHTVDIINIFSSQRYSVVLTANRPIDNYWIRANPSAGPTGFIGGINSAILRYAGAPIVDPITTPDNGAFLNETDLHALINPGAPGKHVRGGADINYFFVVGHNNTSHNFTINGTSFIPPTVPVLLQILNGAISPGTIMPNGSVYSLERNKSVEISFQGGGQHPFHLHGHAFDVVRSAGATVDNYVNPVRRDTVSIGNAGDNVTFRFFTDNPGPWFLHCHIDWHLAAGLALVFAEDAPDVKQANPVNSAWENLCPLYDTLNPDLGLAGA